VWLEKYYAGGEKGGAGGTPELAGRPFVRKYSASYGTTALKVAQSERGEETN